jgi:hypothetical protein
MTSQQWIAVGLFFTFIAVFPCVFEATVWKEKLSEKKEYHLLSPATLKRRTKMNWVGCTLTWLGLGLVSPLMFIYKCIYNLFHL